MLYLEPVNSLFSARARSTSWQFDKCTSSDSSCRVSPPHSDPERSFCRQLLSKDTILYPAR